MNKKYVSNSTESTRMFKNDILESLSKVHYSVPLFVYVPVILYFTRDAFVNQGLGLPEYLACFVSGLVIWTITEYVLHRYVFHFQPKGKIMERLHFIFHGVHHDYPNDARRLVMPPSASIPLALLFYFLFKVLLGARLLSGFFPGFIVGYLVYDMTHYALHHANFKSGFWKKLKKHHMTHHYQDETKGFGVSSAIWDKFFGSGFENKPSRQTGVHSPERGRGISEAGNSAGRERTA